MRKTPKRPKVRKLRRNPLAKALGTPKFRPRMVERVKVYKRRPRTVGDVESED
jgi:hypothetical protein